ncbi:P-loop containing nucleoside triphosphate hydrolase protein [Apiospora arundinis]
MPPRSKRSTRSAAAAAPIAQKEPSPAPLPVEQRASSTSTDIYDVSDRDTRQGRRSTRSTAAAATKSKVSVATASNPRQAAALNSQRKNRDSAMQRLENITSTATGTTNTTEAEADSEASSAEIEMGRRADATPARAVGLGRRTADFSGLDLDDSMFDDLNTTINTAGPTSAQRSLDTSTLSASHFKRRPRGNSFLSRNDGPIRPSSRAGPNTPGFSSNFDITNFRRRAREPSILGTAQKERPQRPEPESDSGEKTDDEEELDELDVELDIEVDVEVEEQVTAEGFAPEAESTPPPRRSSRRSAALAQAQESPSQASASVNPRKRKSTELHEHRPRSSPFADNPLAAEDSESDTESELSLPPPDVRPSTPLMEEEEVAPPLSSSSEEEAEIWPPLKSLAKDAHEEPPLSNGEHQSAISAAIISAKKETKLTTADLTGLLPRRRHRSNKADPFAVEDTEEEAVDATGLGNDDDELYHLEGRSTRRRPAQPLSRAGNKNAKEAAAKPTAAAQRKDKQPAAPANKRQTRRRTYGRNSDKENEGEDQEDNENENGSADPFREEETTENSDELVARVGVELKNASRKFAEVDKWELAYETMTQSSSPHGGR